MATSSAIVDTQCPQIRLVRQTDLLSLSPSSRVLPVAKSPPGDGIAKEAEQEPGLKGTDPTSTLTLVAEAEGKVVAVVHLTLHADQVGYIHGLWIAQPHQESTLAMRMMMVALREGKKLGCHKVDMDASAKAYAVIAMLIECGVGAGDRNAPCFEQDGVCLLDID